MKTNVIESKLSIKLIKNRLKRSLVIGQHQGVFVLTIQNMLLTLLCVDNRFLRRVVTNPNVYQDYP